MDVLHLSPMHLYDFGQLYLDKHILNPGIFAEGFIFGSPDHNFLLVASYRILSSCYPKG